MGVYSFIKEAAERHRHVTIASRKLPFKKQIVCITLEDSEMKEVCYGPENH